MIEPRRRLALPVVVLLVCLVGVGARAQEQPPAPSSLSPPAALAPDPFNASADSLTVLVDYRAADEIQRDLGNAMSGQSMAVQRWERAKMLETLAETRIKLKEVEIQSLEAQVDLAKNEKNELKQKDLEGRKKFAQTEKQLLEKRRDLRSREIAVAKALKEYNEASAKVHQIELELAAQRQQRASLGVGVSQAVAPEFRRLQAEIASLEEKVLNAQVEEANKWKAVADQEAQLVKIRKAVFQSQAKVARGR